MCALDMAQCPNRQRLLFASQSACRASGDIASRGELIPWFRCPLDRGTYLASSPRAVLDSQWVRLIWHTPDYTLRLLASNHPITAICPIPPIIRITPIPPNPRAEPFP